MSPSEQQADRAERLRRAIQAKRAGTGLRPPEIALTTSDAPARLGDWQRGLWFVHQLDPQSPAYNLCSTFRVLGPIDVPRLQRAFEAVASRHRLLRSTFRADGQDALQIVHERVPLAIERIIVEEDGGLEAAAREAAEPFDLERGPLVRLRLIEETSGRNCLLTFVLHHMLADERSLELLWTELAEAYGGRLGGAAPRLQYDDYADWLRHSDRSRRDADLEYWRDVLTPLPEDLRLPFERPAPLGSPHGRLIERTSDRSSQTGIRRLAAAVGATPFMIYAFAFRLLLHRYTEGQPVAFGTPVSMRAHQATADMIGYFLNPVVIAAGVDENGRVGTAAGTFSRDLRDVLAHASVPFDMLATQLSPRRHLDRHPIFQVMFVYQVTPPPPTLGEARLEPVRLDLGASKFDVTLFVTEGEGSLQTAVEFRDDRFEVAPMLRLLEHYQTIIEHLPQDLNRRVADVPLLATREQSLLSTWECGTPLEHTDAALLPRMILDRAGSHPQAPAVVCSGAGQNYADLERAAGAVACALVSIGVTRGDRVGVFFDRSVHMIGSILAAHLAGAAYVPMDPAYPPARNRHLLEDANVAAVLTSSSLRGRLPAGSWHTVEVDTLDVRSARSVTLPDPTPDSPAYILYTSGSTGRPKGVVITHENLRASTLARTSVYTAPPARFLLLPSIAFDSSVAGIFWTLASGGTLVVPSDTEVKDVRSLARLVADERITTVLCVPSLYTQLLATGADRLRGLEAVIVAGESCPTRLAEEHFNALPHVRLFNEYGPTEATVWATVHEVTAEDRSRPVPIGRPIPGVRVQVLDFLGRRVPVGIPASGWIAGPTVARGYWKRDDLTAGRFHDATVPGTNERRYRTGDRMAWTEEGRLLFLGRDDEQIKLRGYRIEPGEIEAALFEDPSIEQVAVVARLPGGRPVDTAHFHAAQLVAFVVAKEGAGAQNWRQALAARVPEHMIPARLVTVPELPRLPNGKIDRRQLEELPLGAESAITAEQPVLSAREQALISLWEGLLGRFGIDPGDNLFELGGHSLLVIQMVAAIERDFDVTLSAADVFQHPTVHDLARRIEARRGPQARTYEQLFPIQPAGHKPPFIMAVPDFFAEALATTFRDVRPVYGIRGVSLRAEGNRGRWSTLTDLAGDVADEIQRRFPDDRYVLGGYSFGAWLAIETARVMEGLGLRIQRLYVVAPMPADFYRMGPFRVRIDGLRQPLTELGQAAVLGQWLRSNHPLTRGPYRRVRQLVAERPWRRMLSLIGSMRRRAGFPPVPRLLHADVRVERFRLHARYRPGPVHTPTIFFNPVGTTTDAAATWRPYFLGPLTIHSIPDPHDAQSVAAARDVVLQHLGAMED